MQHFSLTFALCAVALALLSAAPAQAEARLSNHFRPMAAEPVEGEEVDGEEPAPTKKQTFALGGYLGSTLVDYDIEDATQDGTTVDSEGEYEHSSTSLGIQLSGSWLQEGPLTRVGLDSFLGFGSNTITIKDPDGGDEFELDGAGFEIGTTVWMHFGKRSGANEFGGLVGLGLHVVNSTYDRDDRFTFNEASFVDLSFPLLLGGYGLFPAGDGNIALQGGLEIGLSVANFGLSDSRGIEEDVDYGSSRSGIVSLFLGGAFNVEKASIGLGISLGGTTGIRLYGGFVF